MQFGYSLDLIGDSPGHFGNSVQWSETFWTVARSVCVEVGSGLDQSTTI